jgi:FAD/FMN-containing dehydrogenase
MVALGACGPERMVYGAPRDLLLGLRFIGGNGHLIAAGGKVVKNVSGYDMTRLIVGSAGTLGLITVVTTRVAVLPARCTAISAYGSLETCARNATEILCAMLRPVFVALRPAAEGEASSDWMLSVGFEGFPQTVDYQLAQSGDMLQKGGLGDLNHVDYDMYDGLFAENYKQISQSAFVLRADLPLHRLTEFINSLTTQIPLIPLVVDYGCGRILAGAAEVSDAAWSRLCDLANAQDGHVLMEKAPTGFKTRHDVFGALRPEWKLVHRIKDALDPQHLFAPGSLPGRI